MTSPGNQSAFARWRIVFPVTWLAFVAGLSVAYGQLVPPIITVHPQSQSVAIGADVTFSITITNTAALPLTNRFRKGGANLATNVVNGYSTSFTLQNVQTNDAGSYAIGVLNAAGNRLSSNAVLTVGSLFSTTATLIAESCTPGNGVPDPGELVTFEFALANTNAPATSNLVATLEPGNGILSPSVPQTYENLLYGGLPVARRFTFVADAPCSSNIVASLRLWDGANDLGRVKFNFRLGPTNSECCFDAASADLALTMSVASDAAPPGAGVEYHLSVTNHGPGTATGIRVRLINPTSPGLQFVSATDPSGSCVVNEGAVVCDLADLARGWGTTMTTLVNLTGSQGFNMTNTASVSSFQRDDKPSNNTATVVLRVPAITITVQPESKTVAALTSVSFTVIASSSGPFTYQWQFNGASITGAIQRTLTLTNVHLADAGDYRVVVANSFGGTTSQVATLTVVDLPFIVFTTPPQDQLYVQGHMAQFAASAVGSMPLNYQWRFNGFDIPGATNVSLRLTNLQPANVGEFTIVVTNAFGSVTSAVARLCIDCLDGVVVAWGNNGSAPWDVPVGLTNVTAVSAGAWHSLALRTDGTVAAWKTSSVADNDGNTKVPREAMDITAISAGRFHSLALRSDGTVVGWGSNDGEDFYAGQAKVPNGLTNVTAVAAGGYHSLVLRANGTVVAWGEDWAGKTNVPVGLTNVIAIAAGWEHSVALRADGTVVAWGWGGAGQTNVPVGLLNVVAIAAGGHHNLALRADGTVAVWGSPIVSSISTNVPTGLRNVVAIAAGQDHNVAVRADGTLAAWGGNYDGATNMPSGLRGVVAVAAGVSHSLAVVSQFPSLIRQPASQTGYFGSTLILDVTAVGSGPLRYRWQFNGEDIIGATNATLVLPEVRLNASGSYRVIVSGGDRTTVSKDAVVTVIEGPPSIATEPKDIISYPGGTASFGVIATGSNPLTFQWWFNGTRMEGATGPILQLVDVGWDNAGSYTVIIGNTLGTTTSHVARLVLRQGVSWNASAFPTHMDAITFTDSTVIAMAAGRHHALALMTDGTVAAWGANDNGQATVPSGLFDAVAVAAGGFHSLVLLANRTVVAWGDNRFGQTSVPLHLTNVTAVAGGWGHSLALGANGTVTAWGANDAGQSDVPLGLDAVIAIAAGYSHSMALRAEGTVVVWGGSGGFSLKPPPGLSGIRMIAAGDDHNLALRADGQVIAWGSDSVPSFLGLTDVIGIAAGYRHSLALRGDGTVAAWQTFGSPTFRIPDLSNVVAVAAGGDQRLTLLSQEPIMIRMQPIGPAVYSGTTVLLSARVNGFPPFTYQWRFNGAELHGATNATLELTEARATQGGMYQLVASANERVFISSNVTVNVVDKPPVLPVNPEPQVTYIGGKATFQVVAEGSIPLSYQWRFGEANITGATNRLLIIDSAQRNLAGEYSVVVSNAFGMATSTKARLSILPLVAWGYNFYGDPLSQTNVPADLTNAIAISAGGLDSLALRSDGTVVVWGQSELGGGPIDPGLNDVTAIAQGGSFGLALRDDRSLAAWGWNEFGQTLIPPGLSNVISISAGGGSLALRDNGTVIQWPNANVPTNLTGVVAIASGSAHSLALREDGTVVAWGANDYDQISVPDELDQIVAIAAGGLQSLALRYDGTVVAWGRYSYYGIPPVSPPNGLNRVVAIAAGGELGLALQEDGTVVEWGTFLPEQFSKLRNVVAIACGWRHALALVGDGSPALTVQPVNRTVVEGTNFQFVAMAVGQGVLSYQWQRSGTNIVGATSNRLPLVNVQPEQAEDYRVIVSNALGTVTSKVARLTVLVRPRLETLPENMFAAVGSDVTLFANATGTPPLRYQWRKNGVNIPGATSAKLAITNAQVSDGGSYSVVVANDVGTITSEALLLIVELPGQRADNFVDRLLLTADLVAGTNRWATREAGEPYHAGKFGSNSVWYRWVPPTNGIATFRTVGSTFDTLLGVYTGTNVAQLTRVAEDEDRGGFFTSQLRFNARTNVEYAIAIDGFVGGQGTFILSWTLEPTTQSLPVITDGPRSQTVRRGNDVTLSVSASGTGLTYQWHFNDVAILGANSTTLMLSNVQPDDVGFYTVAITNSVGRGIESLPAVVEIGPFPGVQGKDKLEDLFSELRPPAAPGAPFASASFITAFISVAAGTMDYQIFSTTRATTQAGELNHCGVIGGASLWFDFHAETNATVVIDTQGSTFDTVLAVYRKVTSFHLAENRLDCNADWRAGEGWSRIAFEAQRGSNYYVVVDGAKPTDLTGRAQLNWAMGRLPKIEVAPEDGQIQIGQSRRFWAGVTNAIPPPHYRWFHKGQPIAHATNEWLDLPNLSLDDAGAYSVVVSNALGEVQQLIANLTAPMLTSELKTTAGKYSLTLAPVEFPGLTMVLESSTDLINWTPVQTHTNALAPVSLDFLITPPQRFFRVRPGP